MIAVAAAIIYFCLQIVDVLQKKCRGSEALNSPLFITAMINRLVSLGPLQIILLDIKPDVVMICGRVKLESLGRQAGDSSPLSATQRSGAGERANARGRDISISIHLRADGGSIHERSTLLSGSFEAEMR
ncbi:hypothetical protein BJX66DRAFT_265986 [Aspergillus keveii]|uniref:Uncharacterized protein n=1 Tax=Aspergillus keveii TaxID=714993 RepID=A0ABR4FXV9_9EURO